MAPRFRTQMFFPVDGESAVAELLHEGELWADLRLENLQLHAVGEARLQGARVVMTVYPREGENWWELDYAEARAQLDEAHECLLQNERGREPVDSDGLTVAGEAFSKIAADNERWHPKQ